MNSFGNRFRSAMLRQNDSRPPVWFMRQAGRYHSHYQSLKKTHSFMELCKNPELAREVTLGPVMDFRFDAAILFSDLLFPLEAMGMGLRYAPGPVLDWHFRAPSDAIRFKLGGSEHFSFQADALRLSRAALNPSLGLLGFVGGPLTLFCYAVDGSHSGGLTSSREGMRDGRYENFCERLIGLLAENMAIQARAGADAIAVFDTCAGEFDAKIYRAQVVPTLKRLFAAFHALCPGFPIVYYSKGTGQDHWRALGDLPIITLGVDWRHDLTQVLREWGSRFSIQGNIDPEWLLLKPSDFESRLRQVFERVHALPSEFRRGWICGLGHGVLQTTPESNVRLFLKIQKEVFGV